MHLPTTFASLLVDVLPLGAEEFVQYAIAGRYGIEIRDVDWAKVRAGGADRAGVLRHHREVMAAVAGYTVMHSPDGGYCPVHPDPARVAETRVAVVAFLDFAQDLGVTRLVSHTWFDHSPTAQEDVPGWVARHAAFWQEVLAGRAIEVCLENSWGHTPEVLVAEVDAIGLPQVGACLDVGHAHLQGDSPAHRWVEVLGARLRHLHLHDNDGSSDQHLATGAGTIDWPPLFAALHQEGLRPTATLEVETVPDITASLAHLSRLQRPSAGRAGQPRRANR